MATNRPLTDEKDLLLKLRDGDEAAFKTIYHKYHPALYLYAYKLTEDEDDTADLVQELFITLWESRLRLDIRESLRAYLYRSIRHKFLNLSAHKQVRIAFANGFQSYLDERTASDRVEEKQLFDYLDQIVNAMPEKMGKVFRMRNDNISDAEISAELGISEKTVKNLLSSAMKQVKAKIKYLHFLLTAFL